MTGGGDCPGLNAAIRAVVRTAYNHNIEVIGFKFGWKGIIEKEFQLLDLNAVSGILPRGGTFLGSSRTNPLEKKDWPDQISKNITDLNIQTLIVIGGDGTLRAAHELVKQKKIPIIAIPKTIDNDLMATDFTFGFDTAVTIATDAIDRLHTTAESHQRIMIIEVMGRDTGWIATYAGIAGGADFILIPEMKMSVKDVVLKVKERQKRGKTFSIIVVAEGAHLEGIVQGEKKGIAKFLAERLEKETGYETRVTILGHVQRGGTPTPFDRILATRFGVFAVQLSLKKKLGQMVALHGTKITSVSLEEAVGKLKFCDLDLYHISETFFG